MKISRHSKNTKRWKSGEERVGGPNWEIQDADNRNSFCNMQIIRILEEGKKKERQELKNKSLKIPINEKILSL